MFEVKEYYQRRSFYLSKRIGHFSVEYLHSDGSVLGTREYWPTEEQAQAVLDKYQPPHIWEVGDVLEIKSKSYVFILMCDGVQQLVGLGPLGRVGLLGGRCHIEAMLANATFLFNIKDKLGDT